MEALLPPNTKSMSAMCKRLGMNRQSLPRLIEKRRAFNDTASKTVTQSVKPIHYDSLAEQDNNSPGKLQLGESGPASSSENLGAHDDGPVNNVIVEQVEAVGIHMKRKA
jgi:hypothetical protein